VGGLPASITGRFQSPVLGGSRVCRGYPYRKDVDRYLGFCVCSESFERRAHALHIERRGGGVRTTPTRYRQDTPVQNAASKSSVRAASRNRQDCAARRRGQCRKPITFSFGIRAQYVFVQYKGRPACHRG
jgi:hypothetical protein